MARVAQCGGVGAAAAAAAARAAMGDESEERDGAYTFEWDVSLLLSIRTALDTSRHNNGKGEP